MRRVKRALTHPPVGLAPLLPSILAALVSIQCVRRAFGIFYWSIVMHTQRTRELKDKHSNAHQHVGSTTTRPEQWWINLYKQQPQSLFVDEAANNSAWQRERNISELRL